MSRKRSYQVAHKFKAATHGRRSTPSLLVAQQDAEARTKQPETGTNRTARRFAQRQQRRNR